MLKNKKRIISWLMKHNVRNFVVNNNLSVDVMGDLNLSSHNLKKIPLQFNVVNGDFFCTSNHLKNLKGSPRVVMGHLNCQDNLLKNFKGSPQTVMKDFYSDSEITSLEGISNHIGGDLLCFKQKLKNLNHFPTHLKGDFHFASEHQIKQLAHYGNAVLLPSTEIYKTLLFKKLNSEIVVIDKEEKKGKI